MSSQSCDVFFLLFSGLASYAQERIFLDQQLRFSEKVAVYNELVLLRVAKGSLSMDRLQRTLRNLCQKHKTLRTSLVFDGENSTLKQYITDEPQMDKRITDQVFKNEDTLKEIIYQTATNPDLFDLSSGRVFHYQILRQEEDANQTDYIESITDGDIILLAFHHVVFDLLTSQLFLSDLCITYNNDEEWQGVEHSLEYIDYSVNERIMDMTASSQFWRSQLEGYYLEYGPSLPADRLRSSAAGRSESASVVEISFDYDLSTDFLNYASSHQVTPFQLGLAVFSTFLFKLIHDQNDICISCFDANRHRTEVQKIIGMFVATFPYRAQLDSRWTFNELVKQVREKCLSIFEHSHYPLNNIIADSQQNPSNVPFLETVFDFITVPSHVDRLSFDGANLEQISSPESCEVAKFDFLLRFVHNPRLNDGKLSCRFICSADMFDQTTVITISQRFQYLFKQLVSTSANTVEIGAALVPIENLSLILPGEKEELQTVMFHRLPNIDEKGMSLLQWFSIS